MSLSRGQFIGNYEIIDRLGAGAIGEVYRARDQRLGRDVALKVLQEGLAEDRDRRARFEKEARVAAALNHPNIVGLYDIGEHEGRLYLVTELIEGKTLRERMGGAALPVKELYRMAVQLAEGMAAAHVAGVVHRDLKPENVMVTGDGRVKILDFGLARQGGSVAGADATATLALGETQPGTVMGTATYMSPEQVRGEAVDYRSDQFSFGVMVYEMATGVSPFLRGTAVQTMSAVLTDEPKRMEAGVPAPLQWTIGRCMEKDAAGRYESTKDLARELRGQQEHLSEVFVSGVVAVAAPAAKRSWGWVWGRWRGWRWLGRCGCGRGRPS
jgi:serine/threonine protein kinase